MRWICAVIALNACTPCPPGFSRQDGHCLPESPQTRRAEPLTSESFQALFERHRCQALEDCWNELYCDDLEDCDDEVDCEPSDWTWSAGCTFMKDTANACLTERWSCDEAPVFAEAPESCEAVYDCAP